MFNNKCQYPSVEIMAFSKEIWSRLTTRTDSEGSSKWSSLKITVYGATVEILGFTQRRRNDWITGKSPQVSAQTTRARSCNYASFRRIQELIAKSARDNWQKNKSETVTSMEQALNVVDSRTLYQIIRQASGKPQTLCDFVRDVNGGFIADISTKTDLWREHFKHLLNFAEQLITSPLSYTAEFQPPPYTASCDLPSEEEVADAM
ncbi:unnamed protein product [Dibothriocephalus latus]|uniref:Uncharacterized protein n=1 Tax=Dibothriocephalus latus TaxID=60516 RepID=A0A3P6QT16_DIBLA|nr:unnamed protein product [Dibothriocephalus latus]